MAIICAMAVIYNIGLQMSTFPMKKRYKKKKMKLPPANNIVPDGLAFLYSDKFLIYIMDLLKYIC